MFKKDRSVRSHSEIRKNHEFAFQKTLIQGLRSMVLSSPGAIRVGKKILKTNPWVWNKIKNKLFFQDSISFGFTTLKHGDILIHFSNAPLVDERGIGRVTRELLKSLSKNLEAVSSHCSSDEEYKHVYFYSSIHWCPADPPRPAVVMIHDVIPLLFPDQFPRPIVEDWKNRLRETARKVDHIVTISKSNVQHLQHELAIDPTRISVIHNGVSPLETRADCKVDLPHAPFIVYLGSYDRHKNVEVVLQALTSRKLAEIHLVLIGDNHRCSGVAQRLGIADRVHFLGKLDDGAVANVLKKSVALVFPSLFEGFGLPPLEAALLGVPVICSNRPAMTELIQTGFIFCDPLDPEEWEKAILKVAKAGVPIADLAKLTTLVQNRFSWERSADQLTQTLIKCARTSFRNK
ncbi:glycosyltransferase family 4 protein [Orrella marina]|uniref:Uncharacterized protein n=1 Tax=Orrella marina TaxID=2163011 RepID=A0A2R4XMI9_9BURK|nr:glycosyltransferase family 1 protein [Orrella marina]AWB35013.1 hypothetical protein DBV39_16180 [Orrella marina]